MTDLSATSLVYGVFWLQQSFAILPEGKAKRLADEIDRVKQCRTIGEAMALRPLLAETWLPDGADELDEDDGPARSHL